MVAGRRHFALSRAAPLALLVAVVFGACAEPRFSYVRSGDVAGAEATAFFKLPSHWTVYEEDEVLADRAGGLSEEQLQQVQSSQWLFAFDADPKPSLEHVGGISEHPVGFARVRMLTPLDSDYSVEDLRSEVFPLGTLATREEFELIDRSALELADGIEGERLTFSLDREDGPMTVQQVGAFDEEARAVYLLVVTCESACFEEQRKAIDQVVDSWTVEGSVR